MYYILDGKELKSSETREINAEADCVGYLGIEELKGNCNRLGVSENIVSDMISDQSRFRNSIDVYDEFSIGVINITNVMNVDEPKDRIAFIIRRHQFFLVKIVDEDGSSHEMFEAAVKRFQHNATIEKVIFGVLERLLTNGNQFLEQTEITIMEMEQNLVNGNLDQSLNRDIFSLRNDLSQLKHYYEQLYTIGEELQGNENNLFEESDLRYFKIFTDRADRLSKNTVELGESLIHLREALDASLNYNLNRIMKVFTVVTTIFLPLTLIVGWYGMNFTNMPELSWEFGYPMVILISLITASGSLIMFKVKKYF